VNFLSDRNMEIGEGFRSIQFELKVWNNFKIDSKD
jgi:hypothetical protein